MRKPKVLIFLISDLARVNGSVLWTENLLGSLARLDDLDFTVVSSWAAGARAANEKFVERFGFNHVFVPFREVSTADEVAKRAPFTGAAIRLINSLSDKYFFLFERQSKKQKHVDAEVLEIVGRLGPDLVVVHDIWSAMCIPSAFRLAVPCCLISLNNELAFHRAFRSNGGPLGQELHRRLERWITRHGNWVADWRMRKYLDDLNKSCAGIVTLTRDDLPSNLPKRIVQAVLPPLLKESDVRWSFRESRCLLFVGNVAHFPNRLAIEWLCERFAPELYRVDARARVNIVGASAEQVRREWRLPNINFLGDSNKEEVIRHMMSDDMFIAPIANNFGAKLKLVECAAYGMPFLASPAAMSGLQFLERAPRIDLNRPSDAARTAVEYMDRCDALTDLSRYILTRMRQVRSEQTVAWRDLLMRSMGAWRSEANPPASLSSKTGTP